MTHPSKRKGNHFEREVVAAARAAGLEAERAWGSDGRSMGQRAEVDIVMGGLRVQAKRRARIAADMQTPDGVDLVVYREDGGRAHVIMRLETLLNIFAPGGADAGTESNNNSATAQE